MGVVVCGRVRAASAGGLSVTAGRLTVPLHDEYDCRALRR